MSEGGPAYADAVVLYESDVIQANNKIRNRKLGFRQTGGGLPHRGHLRQQSSLRGRQRDWVDADEEEGAKRTSST
jgi:Ca-activated chloride channel family protein